MQTFEYPDPNPSKRGLARGNEHLIGAWDWANLKRLLEKSRYYC